MTAKDLAKAITSFQAAMLGWQTKELNDEAIEKLVNRGWNHLKLAGLDIELIRRELSNFWAPAEIEKWLSEDAKALAEELNVHERVIVMIRLGLFAVGAMDAPEPYAQLCPIALGKMIAVGETMFEREELKRAFEEAFDELGYKVTFIEGGES